LVDNRKDRLDASHRGELEAQKGQY
jgi:hypothetical protein